MNVYGCRYKGNYGYVCRTASSKWMFVPEMGQADSRVHRNVEFTALAFRNRNDQRFEQERERRFSEPRLQRWLRDLVFPIPRAQTVAGRLLTVS